MPSGAISFRLDYRLNGRRETVYLGKYGRDGISLALARERCLDARRDTTRTAALRPISDVEVPLYVTRKRTFLIGSKDARARR